MGDNTDRIRDISHATIHDMPTAPDKSGSNPKHKPATGKADEQIAAAGSRKHIPWCDDYEKMISGMLYDPWVKPLSVARYNARTWRHHYNSYFPQVDVATDPFGDFNERSTLISQILGRVGENVWIEPPFNFDYGCNVAVGDSFYANFNLVIIDGALVTFGDRVLIGPNVSIYSVNHETGVRSRRANIEYARPVSVGDDCWIGGNVVILPGVTVGKGCTIGAGSVVTKDVPDWSVVVGSPARVIKKVEPVEDVLKTEV